ncbi:MAG: efflux RND transporter permease subunit [Candidatus Omnitrophica bacterium]|nr:efflux RND transporter permease subunit [Candidatus Omnitrophota bacterium]
MRKLIQYCVNHSLFVNLLSVFLFVAGIICLIALRREAFPNISWDIVVVQTVYFGAPPEEIEKLITIELEEELKEVNGIDEMISVSSENRSVITLKLDPDEKNKPKIVNDIQRAVDRVKDLPEDAEDPVVEEVESKDMPVINVSLSGKMSEHELQKIARKLELELLDLPDVARIDRTGWRDREIWVEVDPKKVEDYYLSLSDIILSLSNKNLNIPGGTLDTPKGEYLIRTIGEFGTAAEIEKVIIRANDQGNWIQVQDVAQVQDTFEDDDLIEKTHGELAITLTVVKKEKGDIIRLVEDIKTKVEDFKKDAPEGLRVSYFDDFSYYVKRRLNVLTNNGFIGVTLVVVALFIFLTRTVAIMTAIGIPIAILTAFFVMYISGFTINLITMFALIMVLGMVVDDAIIISENVYRHMEKGKAPREAAVIGTSEVAVPVISTVLTTIVAFVPLFFMSGIMGKFIWAMPMVVIIALSASLFEALFILPSHLADFGRVSTSEHKKKVEVWMQQFQEFYLSGLRWVIKQRYLFIGSAFSLFFLVVIFNLLGLHFVLFPQGLIEEFFIRLKAPIETSIQEMEKKMNQVDQLVAKLPDNELDNFVTRVGMQMTDHSGLDNVRGSHLGQIHIFLTPETTHGRRKADEIIAWLRKEMKGMENLFEEITFEKVRAGPPVGKPVEIRIRGDEFSVLEEVAEKVKARLHKIEGVEDIEDDYSVGKPEIRINVDEEAATKAYLSIRDISTAVRNAMDGGIATKIRKTDEEIDVIVRYPASETNGEEVLESIRIPNRYGNLVALNKVANLEKKQGINTIKHFDRKRLVNVTASVNEEKVTPVEIEKIMTRYIKEDIMPHYSGVNVSFGGEQEETRKSQADFIRAIILAVFLIFIILAANFNSVIQPIVVMMAIPFGITGVFLAFFLHGMALSFMARLGMIGLSGVVVNDAIVLVSFINQLRREGMSSIDAVFEAGRLRLRPVLLTTVTTIAGLLPVAYGIGGNDPFIRPMALAVGWGLFFGTVLTLLVIPCIYVVMADDFSGWCRHCGEYVAKTLWPRLKHFISAGFLSIMKKS